MEMGSVTNSSADLQPGSAECVHSLLEEGAFPTFVFAFLIQLGDFPHGKHEALECQHQVMTTFNDKGCYKIKSCDL